MGYYNGKRIFMSPKVIIGSTDGVTTTLEISEDGYWVIGGVKTEHLAVGQDGATPYIGDDGYWYIDGNNLGVKALGTDGVGISDIRLFETNGNKDTYRITLTNGNTAEFTVTNGTKGEKGDPGVPFKVTKTYASIDAMNKDYSNTSVEEGSFVMIDTGNVNDADNAKLFIKGATAFVYIVDLSGSSGIKGDDGKSAYKLAQETGFEGSLSDWLSSLVGANGKTPYIQDGYWYIDGVSLNVKAAGVDGTSITSIDFVESNSISGVTKHTYRIRLSNGTYTDFVVRDGAQGKRGERGATPTIGVDGYWYIDGENTNVKAEGADGRDGKKGTSVTVSNVSESTASGGSNVVTFSDGKKVTIKNGINGTDGKDGKDGYTPVRGVDYFTEADKSAMVVAVMEAIGTPLFGLVDDNNNVILSGKLGDGSYNIKYEMADGSTVNIGSLVLDNAVYYTISNILTNCTNGNAATKVVEGKPYTATISANEGYELKSVTVTMGGSPVSVTNGVINIASVTGDIVITAVAEEVEVPTSRLPEAYQEVEWVQIIKCEQEDFWSGVHTNVPWNTANKIVAKLQNITSTNANDIIFSAWSSVSSKATPYIATRTSKAPNLFGAQSGLTSYSVLPNNIATNNTEVNELTFEFVATSTADIFIGGWYDATFSHPHKWYSVEIYNGNTLLAHFVPCYRKADNLNGFYDLVGGAFYEDADPEQTFVNRGNEV